MGNELAIVEKAMTAGEGIDALEKVVTHLPEISTPELVTGFLKVNTYSKRIDAVVEKVKKHLVDNASLTGRFLTEGDMDEKGHRYLKGVYEDELKAEKRVSTKFDAEGAEKYLKAEHKNLLKQVFSHLKLKGG